MSDYPAVSIVACCHNDSPLVARALDSVVGQTMDHDMLECIVVYDGTPNVTTLTLMEQYAAKFEAANITFDFAATGESSGYYSAPRNAAISGARGDYIVNVDYDNELTSDAVEVMYKAIRAGTVWPDFVYGRMNYVFDDGARRVHNHRTLPEGLGDCQEWDAHLGAKDSVALKRLASGPMSNFIDSGSFMAARGAYARLELATGEMFNTSYRRFGDWELITRAVFYAGWRGLAVDHTVMNYHWTGANLQVTRGIEGVKAEVM